MQIDVIGVKKNKDEVLEYVSNKLPLISKVSQFNTRIEDIYNKYVEYKILKYEISIRKKSDKHFRYKLRKENINILVNTYTGKSESISERLYTDKIYVSKKYIKSSTMDEEKLAILVKDELYKIFSASNHYMKKDYVQSIKLVELKSIYKPIWVANFKGREIIIEN